MGFTNSANKFIKSKQSTMKICSVKLRDCLINTNSFRFRLLHLGKIL